MHILKKTTFLLILVLFLLNNCVNLPGINKNPNKKNPNKKLQISEYSIDDVKINLIEINKLSDNDINKYSSDQFEDVQNNIKEMDNAYETIMSDVKNINPKLYQTLRLRELTEKDVYKLIKSNNKKICVYICTPKTNAWARPCNSN